MIKDITKLMDEAYKQFMKGKYEKALLLFQEVDKVRKKDLKIKMKIAECLQRLNRKEEALEKFLEIANEYYEKGFLPQAISLSKVLYDLNPKDERVGELIKKLTGGPSKKEEEKPPSSEEREEVIDIDLEEGEEAVEIERAEQIAPEKEEVIQLEETQEEEKKEEVKEEKKPLKIPKILFFSYLSNDEFIDVLRRLNRLVFFEGETILEQGERAKSIYLLTQGEVKVVRKEENGEEKELKILKPGSFIGQYSFFAKTPLPASVIALSDCEILEISERHIKEISKKHPAVQEYVENLYRTNILVPTLSNIPLFKNLPPQDLKDIASKFENIKVEKGQHVIIEGKPGEAFYIIRSGEFMVTRGIGGGKRIKLAELKDGDFMGEISLLTGEKTTATVTAVKKSEVMKIDKEKFKELLLEYPTIMETVSKYMEERIKDTKKKVREALEREGII